MELTREQIENWLALEGWEITQESGCVPIYNRGRKQVFANHNCGYYRDRPEYYDIEAVNFVQSPRPVGYEDLQLIYQEIIKHEKD